MTVVIFVLFRFRGASGVARRVFRIDTGFFVGNYNAFNIRQN